MIVCQSDLSWLASAVGEAASRSETRASVSLFGAVAGQRRGDQAGHLLSMCSRLSAQGHRANSPRQTSRAQPRPREHRQEEDGETPRELPADVLTSRADRGDARMIVLDRRAES
jgi:hypothetical protein